VIGETDLFAPFLDSPGTAAVVVDFDGTLAPIVTDPAAAEPVDGASDALVALTGSYGLVAVMSGRPIDFLRPLLPSEIVISGLYGLEVERGGQRFDHPGAGAWREAVADVVRISADRGPEGMVVESKGLSLTLHYRNRPEIGGTVSEWARQQAVRSGLEVRTAKMSIELHPPIAADKGTALEAITEGLASVCFVGDDQGDLPAYDALDRLASQGVHTVRVAVASAETPIALVERADVVLDSPAEVLALLRRLAAPGGSSQPAAAS
jgi:trehalose 6-phosphate phosphatase